MRPGSFAIAAQRARGASACAMLVLTSRHCIVPVDGFLEWKAIKFYPLLQGRESHATAARLATDTGVDWRSSRSVRQNAEPPLRRKE